MKKVLLLLKDLEIPGIRTVWQKGKMYDVICSDCGCQTQVPFKPISGKEVYCKVGVV